MFLTVVPVKYVSPLLQRQVKIPQALNTKSSNSLPPIITAIVFQKDKPQRCLCPTFVVFLGLCHQQVGQYQKHPQ